MKAISRNRRRELLVVLVIAVLALLALNVTISYAGTGSAVPIADVYEIAWYTFDGGGAQDLTNGAYTLSGTSGQSDAGALSQASYLINGGYWVDVVFQYFLPAILK